MGTHVESVRDKGNGAEQETADNFGDHHEAAQRNDGPRLALVRLMPVRQKDMAVDVRVGCPTHRSPHFR
jgi:hypothetical protein